MVTVIPADRSNIDRKMILMVGTSREGAGGIASVISTYAAHGLFSRWPIVTLDSHVMGSKWHKARAFFVAWMRFVMILARGRVAVLHLHSSSGPSFLRKACFACIAFMFRCPVLLHIHSGEFVSYYQNSSGPLIRRLVRFVFERSERVIALSPTWRARYLTIAPGATVICIPNPVLVAPGCPRQLRHFTVVFLGKICAEKGVYDLIKAWKFVHRSIAGAQLVIAGEGELDAARREIEQSGLNTSVVLPGWVSGVEKEKLIEGADICVLPSYFEGMPMSVLEAMGSGIPCVASAVGGIPDMIDDRVEGRLIEPGNVTALAAALIELLGDRDAYGRMSKAALARFKSNYAADVVIPKLEALYAEVSVGS